MLIAVAVIESSFIAYAVDLKRYGNLRDPTYQEALQFVSSDQTDKNQYNQSYTCVNFATDFVNNAVGEGYRCGYVIIEYSETSHTSHAMVCFNTSDNGLIFVEPQNDKLVTLASGQPYLDGNAISFSITWPVFSEFLFMMVLSLIILPFFMMTLTIANAIYKR